MNTFGATIMKTLLCSLAVLCTLTVATASADAVSEGIKEFGKAVFSEAERQVIRDYYQSKYGSIDGDDHDQESMSTGEIEKKHKGKKHKGKKHKGKGHSTALPPGIAKKSGRGGTLPPGLAKKGLSSDLESRLPPVREGYERAEIDGEIVLLDAATQEITDVLDRTIENVSRALVTDNESSNVQKDKAQTAEKSSERAVERASSRSWWEFWKD